MEDNNSLVVISNAYKRYSAKNVVLAGLNMKIEKGTIYGLLGPSGCGKSTLLSCLVGRLSLDSGKVEVNLNDKKEMGYMPQDIALNFELSIGEQLAFYGRIYLMSWEKVVERIKELTDLLELPPNDRLVSKCSGGQQRRISMAIALIHDPELLILDEPTVGIDPLLCASIWECFSELVKVKGKTIVITTHYIEEAKAANSIGLMRNGVLLAENSPQKLMEQLQCDTLEEVFLTLSKAQGENFEGEYPAKQKQEPLFQTKALFSRRRFMAHLRKNWIWTTQNLGVTLFVMFIPTLCVSICCSTNLTGIVTVPIGIVSSPELKCPSNSKPIRECLKISDFICRYVEILESEYPLEFYHDHDEAIRRAKKGYLTAVLDFHNNYTEALMERIEFQSKTGSQALEESTLYGSFDMSSYPTTHAMTRRVYLSLEKLLYEICSQCNIDSRLARVPLKRAVGVHGSLNWKYQDSFLPSTVVPFLFNTMMIYSSSALSMEVTSGLLERYQCAGLTLSEILLAQMVLQMIVMNLQNVLMLFIVYGAFKMVLVGSYAIVVLIIMLTELLGMMFGMIVALLIHHETAVSCIGCFIQLGTFLYCGCLWPIEGQHWIVQLMGSSFPLVPLSKSYFNVALKGWGLDNFQVFGNILYSMFGAFVTALIPIFLIHFDVVKV